MKKFCPLSMIGSSSGKAIICPGEGCMFWRSNECSLAMTLYIKSLLLDKKLKAGDDYEKKYTKDDKGVA